MSQSRTFARTIAKRKGEFMNSRETAKARAVAAAVVEGLQRAFFGGKGPNRVRA